VAKKNPKQQNKITAVQSMSLAWSDEAWDDYLYWHNADNDVFDKINELIEEIKRTPFTGTGKPEPLKGDLSGYFSRRITHADRLVYMYESDVLYVIQCRYHY
jgi:toxin YoeB